MKNIACAELLAFLLVNWPFLGVEKRSLAQNVQEEQTFPTHPDPKRWDENSESYGCSKSRRWQVRGYWGVAWWSSSCSRFALRAKLVCRASSNSPITSQLGRIWWTVCGLHGACKYSNFFKKKVSRNDVHRRETFYIDHSVWKSLKKLSFQFSH